MSNLDCIIGIRGALQSGKNTVANILSECFDIRFYVEQRSFAANLRLAVSMIFGVDTDDEVYEDFKKSETHVMNLYAAGECDLLSGRELLQFFGTEICRTMDPDCWARGPITYFKKELCDIGIIPDLRFPNEVNAIRDNDVHNFIIKVERPGFTGDNHESEHALDNYKKDDFIIVNDGILDDLRTKVGLIAEQIEKVIS